MSGSIGKKEKLVSEAYTKIQTVCMHSLGILWKQAWPPLALFTRLFRLQVG